MTTLGKLVSVNVREAWPHEAADFTPWLLAHAEVLAEALGMDLELHEAEHSVGGFSLDLMGTDSAGHTVIVENQLEASDHRHLGQLLTYAGGTDPMTVVWIADEFRAEHRAALDWLNERTGEDTRFFAVQVDAVRIGDSPIAPRFTVVVQPNDWQKEIKAATAGSTPRQQQYKELWTAVLERLREKEPGWTNARIAPAQSWMTLPAGVSGAAYSVLFSREGRCVEIYFGSSDATANDRNLDKVRAHREAIESAFGHPLDWQELDGKKATRIRYTVPGDIDDDVDHVDWFVTEVIALRKALTSVGGLPALLSAEH